MDGELDLNVDFNMPYPPGQYGTLTWGQGDYAVKTIDIPINADGIPEFNEDINIILFVYPGHSQDLIPFQIPSTTVTILYNDYPAGALDDQHNPDFNLATSPLRFLQHHPDVRHCSHESRRLSRSDLQSGQWRPGQRSY
jgi:hypothetical protein